MSVLGYCGFTTTVTLFQAGIVGVGFVAVSTGAGAAAGAALEAGKEKSGGREERAGGRREDASHARDSDVPAAAVVVDMQAAGADDALHVEQTNVPMAAVAMDNARTDQVAPAEGMQTVHAVEIDTDSTARGDSQASKNA